MYRLESLRKTRYFKSNKGFQIKPVKAKNIGALIPVRLKSERLPGKAIMPMVGKPAICHLLDRACASRYLDRKDVVVCTTKDASDDPLVKIVEDYGASIFRGSTDDIVRRFYDAMERYGFEAVIQIDGDDILSETIYMDYTMERLLSDQSLDIVTTKGLPLGIATKSFTMVAMKKVIEHYRTVENDTGFIYFFTKSGLCNHIVLDPISEDHEYDEARLTLDYKEDYELLNTIFQELYVDGELFSIDKIVRLFKSKPELKSINGHLNEEYWQRTRELAKLDYIDQNGVRQSLEL